jgi:hypothetical protein
LTLEYPAKKALKTLQKEDELRYSLLIYETRNTINLFEESLRPENMNSSINGPEKFIDLPSFINYFLIQEVTKNVDGYRRSVYFHQKNGKIHAGPVWDFNLAWGGLWYAHENKPEGWQIETRHWDGIKDVFWFARLFKTDFFRRKFLENYQSLRQPNQPLNRDEIFLEIDKNYALLKGAQLRHFSQWNLLGGPILIFFLTPPSLSRPYYPSTYEGEIEKLKDWINHRLGWLDDAFPKLVDHLAERQEEEIPEGNMVNDPPISAGHALE